MKLQEKILNSLLEYRIPGLPLDEDFVYSKPDGYCISNLPATISRLMDVRGFPTPAMAPEIQGALGGPYQQVVLLVVDGLGYDMYHKLISSPSLDNQVWQTAVASGMVLPLTSVSPSTTASALTSLWTGRDPLEHGIMGYEMWLREYGIVANMILHNPASYASDIGGLKRANFDPETFLTVDKLAPFLKLNGVEVTVLQHRSIAKSGLSSMLMGDATTIPYRSLPDMWITLKELLNSPIKSPRYVYSYWGDFDETQHYFGLEDSRVEATFREFQRGFVDLLNGLKPRAKQKTLILMVADHGQIATPILPEKEIRSYPDLVNKMHILPTGESRLPFIYPGLETGKEILHLLEEKYPGQFIPLSSTEAANAGLFGQGKPHPDLHSRIGDYVLLARDRNYIWWAQKENQLLGRHGGLNREEMIVPLIALQV